MGRSLAAIGLMLVAVLESATLAGAQVCATLPAWVFSFDGKTLSPQAETRLDTKRIQDAVNRCPAGQSVVLTASDSANSFVSGALTLKPGITLVIARGSILFASREARVFQVAQGRCGVVDDKGTGCKPLLACGGRPRAAIAGNGIIDGRGQMSILGETYSWQDLAAEARLTNGKVNAPALLQDCERLPAFHVLLRNPPLGHADQ